MSKVQNEQVCGQPNYSRAAPIFHFEAVIAEWACKLNQDQLDDLMDHTQKEHRMHMLIVALDYKRSSNPLTCTIDAKYVEEFARKCGVNQVLPLYDEECSKDAVLKAIQKVGSNCGPEDIFIFYYAGHGLSGKEVTAEEAFALLDQRTGKVAPESLLQGSDFCRAILNSCLKETRILIMNDLCHRGTIIDLSHDNWMGREAVAISGSHDGQRMNDSRCGIFTHSMLLAIDRLSTVNMSNYSVGMLYNAMLFENENIFSNMQNFTIQTPSDFGPDLIAWPLVPPTGYLAPLHRCPRPGDMGVSPNVLSHVQDDTLNESIDSDAYISYVEGHASDSRPSGRACDGCISS